MAQITDKASVGVGTGTGTDSNGCFFLGCFGGINNKGSVEKGDKAVRKKEKKTRSSVCFSWSKLKKRSFPRKTVPLEYGENKVHSRKGSIFHINSDKKQLKDQISGSDMQKIVQDDHPNQTKCDDVQEILLNNNKSKNHLDSLKKPTCKKVLSGNATSPEDKFEVLSRGKVAGPQLSQSVSIPQQQPQPPPPPRRKNKTVNNNISGGNSKVNNIKEETYGKKKFDQFVGVTMIMITLTLIVMIFCGKICAILCTCGWFYFYPNIVVSREKDEPKVGFGQEIIGSKSAGDEIDFNSPEYKKKVVLEGFLERSHRIH